MLLHNQGQSFDWVMYRMVRTLQGVKLNLAWMDFCSLLPQKTKSNVCSSSMCILNVIIAVWEGTPKVLHELGRYSFYWIMYSYFVHVLVHACTLKAYLAPLQ